ncbi:MAG: hypothetical protein ACXWAT_10425 [Methylobacter sp.]
MLKIVQKRRVFRPFVGIKKKQAEWQLVVNRLPKNADERRNTNPSCEKNRSSFRGYQAIRRAKCPVSLTALPGSNRLS